MKPDFLKIVKEKYRFCKSWFVLGKKERKKEEGKEIA